MLFDDDGAVEEFDAVIMNPPYFKIGAESAACPGHGGCISGQHEHLYALHGAGGGAAAAERGNGGDHAA